jgi:drug/metabolite transporter (DMT)-like permease
MPTNVRVFIALILSMIFWSFSYVWVKIAYEVFQPLTTVTLRLLLSSALLFVVLHLMRKLQPVSRSDWKWFLLLAFFEPFMYFMGESFGLKEVSSTLGSVIISTIPLFTPLTAWFFYKEKLSWLNFVGIIISFAGVGCIVVEKDFSLSAPAHGIALMFFAVFSALGYAVVLKRLSHHYNPFTIIAWQNLIGIFMFLPFFFTFEWQQFIATPVTLRAITAIVELTIFASSLAFILFTYGIRHIGITRANVFTNTIPIFTAIIAWWILDEPMKINTWMGIAIVIGGLFITQFKFRRNDI